MKPVILLDCDGPLSQFTQAYLDALHAVTGYRHYAEEVDRWAIHECDFFKAIEAKGKITDLRRRVDDRVKLPGFCEHIAPQPGAQEAVETLSRLGDVYVVTSPWDSSPTWMYERARWVAKHFPTIGNRRVIQTAQKHLVRGDVFVDDKPEHVIEWSAAWPESTAILFDMHHNRGEAFTKTWRGGWRAAIEAASQRQSVEGAKK